MAVTVTMEDVDFIIKKTDERYDNRYVKQEDCNDTQQEINKKFANDDKRIELGLHDFAVIKKLMWIVATTGIGSLVTAIFNLITK